ncbi:sigma-70 family RNA polymerase sigma factor [Metallumcola ferriviriculae]|uniref:Sigma-70 family RNA polymerase sigma factor n=1 Tax=Metallumcola ferriviriculae TaxID=3039180 RepID=A0AAU0UK64_9FIRM|nr:sigma-70 family RNA polymerase sigma factor [Desulfitibacteraceae bacterium MK1]
MNEIKIIKAAQRGDRQAYEKLVEIYDTQLFRTAYGILGNREDALDAVQDAFWQGLKSISRLSDPVVFRSWLTRILVNKCMDLLRKNKRVVVCEDFSQLSQPGNDIELSIDMAAALAKLGDKYRLILSLRYFQDLSISEIAHVLECPEGTVKSRLHYALMKLKQELKYGREVVK